jgi:hypothetical protein
MLADCKTYYVWSRDGALGVIPEQYLFLRNSSTILSVFKVKIAYFFSNF